MKPKNRFLLLCVLGTVLPYWQFVAWLSENGLNGPLFFHQLLANRISTFFVLDVLVSAVTLFALVRYERRQLNPKWWWLPLVAVVTVGVSLGLPLFLYMRELRKEAGSNPAC